MTGQRYRTTSTAVLIVAAAALTLPLFFSLISKATPFTQCASLTLFRNPCPMCGLTRGFFNIWHLNLAEATRLNILSIPLFLLFGLEVIFRAVIVTQAENKPILRRLAPHDLRIHALLGACYLVYAAGFVILKWDFTL